MTDIRTVWESFVKSLRADQDKLREYLAPFEAGSATVGGSGGDRTAQEIETVRQEIASLQETIDRVEARQGLRA